MITTYPGNYEDYLRKKEELAGSDCRLREVDGRIDEPSHVSERETWST